MLSTLVDRTWTATALFALAAWTVQTQMGAALGPTARWTLQVLLGLWWGAQTMAALRDEQAIDRRGGRAAVHRTWTPFNVGTVARLLYSFARHRNHEVWEQMFARSGAYTVETNTFGQRLVFTADEENIKAILATQFREFGKGPRFREEWEEFLGHSIFTTDGEKWHEARALLRPQFIKERVADLETFEHHVQKLLPLLAGANNDGAGPTVRIDDLFFRFTLDAATDFLLGSSVDSLTHEQSDFAEAFGTVQNTQAIISRMGPINGMVPRRRFRRALGVLNRFVSTYIDRALALTPAQLARTGKTDREYTFLHALAGHTRDRRTLRDQLVAVLLAGRDTTAVALSWLFYELARHPDVVARLRREIEARVGFDRPPTYEDLKSMRFLQHTLNETLRLYPVVPYNVRVALCDTTLPRGGGLDGREPVGVTNGTPICYSTLLLHRRSDVYPATSPVWPDHREFAPQRWEQWTPEPWTYIPFNGGPRICIGQQFALGEMGYTAVRILQRFGVVEPRGGFPGFRTDIVLQPAEGVWVGFTT